MAQYDIGNEVQNLLLNYPNRVIRASTDYQILTIGRLQLENLDWKFEPEYSKDVKVYLQWDPWDWASPKPFDNSKGKFKVTKYGLSYRPKPLLLGTYKPLWEPGTAPEIQSQIMLQEMYRIKEHGAKHNENVMEIVPESPLWNTVDTLAIKARSAFRTNLSQKAKDLESRGIQCDGENLLNDGVRVTPEIAAILRQLNYQIAR